MRSLLILTIAFLSLVVARSQEWATQPSEMSEASAQASRPYRVKVTSPHPFARQIGPPMGAKRVITPVPKDIRQTLAAILWQARQLAELRRRKCQRWRRRADLHVTYCEQTGLETATTVAQVLSTRYGFEQREVLLWLEQLRRYGPP